MVINNIIKPEMNVTFGNEIFCLQTNKNTKHSLVLKIAQKWNNTLYNVVTDVMQATYSVKRTNKTTTL